MSKLKRRSPCNDCPWRRKSVSGWLGEDKPVPFLFKTDFGEGDMPCHTAIDYDDPDWRTTQLPDSPYCVGGLQYLNNQLKLPKNPELAEACGKVGRNPDVFSWPWEFLSHHMRRAVGKAEAIQLMWNHYFGGKDAQQT